MKTNRLIKVAVPGWMVYNWAPVCFNRLHSFKVVRNHINSWQLFTGQCEWLQLNTLYRIFRMTSCKQITLMRKAHSFLAPVFQHLRQEPYGVEYLFSPSLISWIQQLCHILPIIWNVIQPGNVKIPTHSAVKFTYTHTHTHTSTQIW